MLNKRESNNATRASIKKEMAKPRMAKSARIAELNLDAARTPGQARTTVPGTVNRIVPFRPNQPEKAHIDVNGSDDRYRDLRIENALIDGNGDKVRLKRGAHVGLTVTAKPKR
jgi:hypothetical protein